MPALIFHSSEILAEWAARRIGHVAEAGFGPCTTIGIASGDGAEHELYGVCVYHDYQEAARTLQLSMAARSPKWATRGVIAALLAYPFDQLHINKLWTLTPIDNERALRFNVGIGMLKESVLRHQFGANRHAVVCSMMEMEYRNSRWCALPALAA
jgi:RimJ/RimL family protein N-acetyltransferase